MEIEKHQWSDDDLSFRSANDCYIKLDCDLEDDRDPKYIVLSEDDAIEIAKHFKLI